MARSALTCFDEGPVSASRQETADVILLERLLEGTAGIPALVGPDGQKVQLPEPVFRVLACVLRKMAQGNAVAVVPVHHELTTQEAADLLNVSRPFLVRLLEQDHIPFHRTGTHRRVRFQDLMAYRQQRDGVRAAALDELAAEDARLTAAPG